MIFFIAILVAFFGGLIGRGLALEKVHHRILAFLVPVALSTALLHIPLLPRLMELVPTAVHPLDWEALKFLGVAQGVILLIAVLLTGLGWLCAMCIQKSFED